MRGKFHHAWSDALGARRKGAEGLRMASLAIVALAAFVMIAWISAGKAIEWLLLLQSYFVTSSPLPSEVPAKQPHERHRAHRPTEAVA